MQHDNLGDAGVVAASPAEDGCHNKRPDGRVMEAEELTQADILWMDLQDQVPKMSLDACLGGGKALVSALAILLPAHLALLALMGARQQVTVELWHLAPTALWLVAGAMALRVLLPWYWRFHINDPEDIRKAFWRMVNAKKQWAWWSAVLVGLGVVVAVLTWASLVVVR